MITTDNSQPALVSQALDGLSPAICGEEQRARIEAALRDLHPAQVFFEFRMKPGDRRVDAEALSFRGDPSIEQMAESAPWPIARRLCNLLRSGEGPFCDALFMFLEIDGDGPPDDVGLWCGPFEGKSRIVGMLKALDVPIPAALDDALVPLGRFGIRGVQHVGVMVRGGRAQVRFAVGAPVWPFLVGSGAGLPVGWFLGSVLAVPGARGLVQLNVGDDVSLDGVDVSHVPLETLSPAMFSCFDCDGAKWEAAVQWIGHAPGRALSHVKVKREGEAWIAKAYLKESDSGLMTALSSRSREGGRMAFRHMQEHARSGDGCALAWLQSMNAHISA